jgi:hypothetical protein
MKLLKVLCVLALAFCFTANVYAETQSVKVSGDLTMRGIYRDQYNLIGSQNENLTVNNSAQDFFMTVAAVQVDADLTDNVQTVIRVLNQRDWNVTSADTTVAGAGNYNSNGDEFDVMIDLAYVQLKNFVYSPLTLTIGRQDLWFGRGFVIGANQQNPGTGSGLQGNNINAGNLSAPEYTAINSFDAVKAVLDYDPWTITGIYSKISENAVQVTDDVNLWGVNVGYKFNKMNGEAEGYWFYKKDESLRAGNNTKYGNDVYTLGARGSFDPINWVTLAAEGAWQGGNYIGSVGQSATRPRSAWALDVSGEARYFTDKFAWKPKFGAEYIYYSGNKSETDGTNGNVGGTYTGWDSMYRGKYDSAIREFVGKFYQTMRYPANSLGVTADDSRTNQHQVVLSGSIQPMDSLLVKANYNLFWNQYQFTSDQTSGGWIGSEFDVQANWDYTEDVSFNLLAGWFMPGTVYYNGQDKVATDLVGSVKVSF